MSYQIEHQRVAEYIADLIDRNIGRRTVQVQGYTTEDQLEQCWVQGIIEDVADFKEFEKRVATPLTLLLLTKLESRADGGFYCFVPMSVSSKVDGGMGRSNNVIVRFSTVGHEGNVVARIATSVHFSKPSDNFPIYHLG